MTSDRISKTNQFSNKNNKCQICLNMVYSSKILVNIWVFETYCAYIHTQFTHTLQCPPTCSLCLGWAARLLSTELAEADTLPRGSFSNFATAWSPSLLRLHSAGRRRAWTIASWSHDARLCTNHTVGGMLSLIVTDQKFFYIHLALCVRYTFFCQLGNVCFHVTDVVGLQVTPQLEKCHHHSVSVAVSSW